MATKTFMKSYGATKPDRTNIVLALGCLLVVGACASNEPRRTAGLATDDTIALCSDVAKTSDTGGASGSVCFGGCSDALGNPLPPGSCDIMPITQCPPPVKATTASGAISVTVPHQPPVIANYGGCGGTVIVPCDSLEHPPTLTVNATVQLVFEGADGDHTSWNVYPTRGATDLQSPNGKVLFPLLEAGQPFADQTKPVEVPGYGKFYPDLQDDCVQLGGGRCGCTIC